MLKTLAADKTEITSRRGGGDNAIHQVNHGGGPHRSQMRIKSTPRTGSRGLRAVIHYLHGCIPFGRTKEVIATIPSEASARDVERDLSRSSNKMTPADNPRRCCCTIPTCPNTFTNRRDGERQGSKSMNGRVGQETHGDRTCWRRVRRGGVGGGEQCEH